MIDLKPEHKRAVRVLAWILFSIYIGVLIYLMFLSERYGRGAGGGEYRYNLVPFKEIIRYFKYHGSLSTEAFFINTYGNVLAFMPFGFTIPVISRKNSSFLAVLLSSFELTLTIEILQLLLRVGCFDVDDMILNVLGGVLGYFCYRLTRNLAMWWLHKKHNSENR